MMMVDDFPSSLGGCEFLFKPVVLLGKWQQRFVAIKYEEICVSIAVAVEIFWFGKREVVVVMLMIFFMVA